MDTLERKHGKHIKHWTDGVPVEADAWHQLCNISDLPIIGSHIAVMPDVHVGKGATVGSVIPTVGAIIPAAVGVDIGCVDKDTEFLSSTGWKKISEYNDEDVLVYNIETQISHFEKPQKYIVRPNTNGFIHFKTKYGIDQMLSFDHKVLVYQYTRAYDFINPLTISAKALLDKHNSLKLGYRHRIKTSPENINIVTQSHINDEYIRVIVMCCADGHYYENGNKCVLRFKKERKVARAKELLAKANISIEYERVSDDDITSLTIVRPANEKTLTMFWNASIDQLKIISDEVLYWDGNIDEKCFYSSKKEEADFIHYCFMASGYRSVLRLDRGIEYRVYRHDNTIIGFNGTPKTNFEIVPSTNGREYCFTVSTGFFLIRRNGQIAITGNCGMCAVKTTLTANDLPDSLKLTREAIENAVPCGEGKAFARSESKRAKIWKTVFDAKYDQIIGKYPKIKPNMHPSTQMGTLGGGNHFIELCLDEHNDVWIMLHSGSRGIGNRIGNQFIYEAKEDMARRHLNIDADRDLSYLHEGSDLFNDYILALRFAQEYAKINRDLMLQDVIRVVKDMIGDFKIVDKAVNSHHNYVEREFHFGQDVWLTRKGAVSAKKGELGIIPGSMGAKSFIVEGKGNADSFHSCSHGAGRRLSRSGAKAKYTLDDHIAATEGVECRKDMSVLDETPMAYKSIDDVMQAQLELVDIKYTLKQVVCVKG